MGLRLCLRLVRFSFQAWTIQGHASYHTPLPYVNQNATPKGSREKVSYISEEDAELVMSLPDDSRKRAVTLLAQRHGDKSNEAYLFHRINNEIQLKHMTKVIAAFEFLQHLESEARKEVLTDK